MRLVVPCLWCDVVNLARLWFVVVTDHETLEDFVHFPDGSCRPDRSSYGFVQSYFGYAHNGPLTRLGESLAAIWPAPQAADG